MKKKFAKWDYYFLNTALSLTLLGLSVLCYQMWGLGPTQSGRIHQIFEANFTLENLNDNSPLKLIKKEIQTDRSRMAIKNLEKLSLDIKSISQVLDSSQKVKLENSSRELTKSLGAVISLPHFAKIVKVLSIKIKRFHAFVIRNKWRTLTRVSSRMKFRINTAKTQQTGLAKFAKKVHQDIRFMEIVTEKSVLSSADKSIILARISSFKTEMKMIDQYVSRVNRALKSYRSYLNDYRSWMSYATPQIVLEKMSLQFRGRNLLFLMLGLIILTLSLIFIARLIHQKALKKNERETETLILKTINEGIVNEVFKLEEPFSAEFYDRIKKQRDYVHKRISFGALFQQGLPFSALLLDSNLSMIWANNLFYQNFKLDKFQNEESALSWDYFQRFTNLGEDDPVVNAIQQNMAGIYQVQVRLSSDSDVTPYEMYVSPIEYSGQKRLMIFFYPLRSLEQTLKDQNQSLMGPVMRSLEALSAGRYTKEFRNKIASDFEIADIANVHERFLSVDEMFRLRQEGLLTEMTSIENALYDHYKYVDDINIVNSEINKNIGGLKLGLDSLKDQSIHNIEALTNTQSLAYNIYKKTKVIHKFLKDEIHRSNSLSQNFTDMVSTMDSISMSRVDLKIKKGELENQRKALLRSLEQLMIFVHGKEFNASEVKQALTVLKGEILNFDDDMQNWQKWVSKFDTYLSKGEQLIDGFHNMGDVLDPRLVDETMKNLENMSYGIGKVEADIKHSEDVLCKSYQKIQEGLREFYLAKKSMSHLLLGARSRRDEESSDYPGVLPTQEDMDQLPTV